MKKNLLLVGILVALILVYWLMQSKRPVVTQERPFIEVDSAAVTALHIVSPTDTVDLAKQGDKWYVTRPIQYPTVVNQAEDAVAKLAQIDKLSLITERPERFREFEVDDSAGTRITCTQKGKVTTIVVGKSGPTFQTSYARLEGSNEVWEVSGNILPSFKRKLKDWRDRTIVDVPMADIQKMTLRSDRGTTTVTLVDSTWKVESPSGSFDADRSQVERLTRLLAKISAAEFADTLKPEFWTKPEYQITADLASGETIQIKLARTDETGNKYFLHKEGAPVNFVVFKATAENLMKKPEDFKTPPPRT